MGVGVGGLGCASVLSLAAAGVDRLVLVDRDYVALSDLNRQVPYRSADLGKCKVEAVSEALKTFNPSIEVEALDVEVHEDSAPLASRVDLVVDGLDNYEARFALNKACVEKRKPFIHAAVQSLEEARDYSAGLDDHGIGAMQAAEVVKYATGIGDVSVGGLLIVDLQNLDFFRV